MPRLMGYLLGLDRERLARLAAAWGISVEQPAAALYNALTDPWRLSSVRERLSPSSRAVLDLLVERKGRAVPFRSLAAEVGEPAEALRRRILSLSHRGLVIASPEGTLSMPDEIVAATRLLNKLMAGSDPSIKTVGALLAVKSLPDLQRLARRWQVPDTDTRLKRELVDELSARLTSPAAVKAMAKQLSLAARNVLVRVARAGGRVEVRKLKRLTDLEEPELWAASRELIDLALAGESYAGATRSLFTPVGLGVPEENEGANDEVGLVALPGPPVLEPGFAFAWDLTTLLALFRTADPPIGRLPVSAAQRRWLLARLHDDGGGNAAERLSFLLAAAVGLRLLALQNGAVAPTRRDSEWDAVDFGSRSLAVFRWWLGSTRWREGLAASDQDMGGPIALAPGRERIVRLLMELKPSEWYSVDALLGELRRREPLLFRDRDMLATGGDRGTLERIARNWHRWDGRLARASLSGPLRWLEAVSYREHGAQSSLSVTALGAWLFGCASAEPLRWPSSAPVNIADDGSAVVLWPSGNAVSVLSRLATLGAGEGGPRYIIDAAAVRRAVFAGASAESIITALRDMAAVPPRLLSSIEGWAKGIEPVKAWDGVVLQTESPEAAARLESSPRLRSAGLVRLAPSLLLIRDRRALAEAEPALRAEGYLIKRDEHDSTGI